MIQRLQEMRNEEGFTLIELLIVIIVLGILAAIVVFAIGSTRSDAAQSACKTDVKSVQLAAEAYNTTNGHYPDDQASVTATGSLLKEWPTNSEFGITYLPTIPSGGTHATDFKVSVQDKDGHDITDGASPPVTLYSDAACAKL